MTALTIAQPASTVMIPLNDPRSAIVDLSEFKEAHSQQSENDCQFEEPAREAAHVEGADHDEVEEEDIIIPVREGATVRFPSNPVSATHTRPATLPSEKSERYYVPDDFKRFRREYRETIRRRLEEKRRRAAAAGASVASTAADPAGGSSMRGDSASNASRFASPLTALINAAARSFVSVASASAASSTERSVQSGSTDSCASTSTLIDTLYLF